MIPLAYLKLGGAAALVAACAWAGYAWRDRSADADLAKCQRVHAEAVAVTLRAAQQAEADHRAREAQINAKHQETVDAALARATQARADADRVRAALERLRHAAATATPGGGAAAANPSAAGASAAAGAPSALPPDLLWRLGQAAGELAAAADDARTAGLACQRAYEAVTTSRL